LYRGGERLISDHHGKGKRGGKKLLQPKISLLPVGGGPTWGKKKPVWGLLKWEGNTRSRKRGGKRNLPITRKKEKNSRKNPGKEGKKKGIILKPGRR